MDLSPAPPTAPPPTQHTEADALPRLRPKTRFPLFRHSKSRHTLVSNVSVAALPLAGPDPFIRLNPSSATSSDDGDQDQYRWAVVYENQRGLTLFSALYYSPLSLLPTDPSPFTIPNSSYKRSKQPDVSLAVYPLPDGAWRWLSPWMIDMRSDSGEVQYDGFEYNFMFRTHKWHPNAGPMSWVRRRRWIRLMMRPAKKHIKKPDDASPSPNTLNTPGLNTPTTSVRNRYSVASSFPPSVVEAASFYDVDVDEVWLSGDADANWERCHVVMRRAGRDGRILELWRRWLGDEPDPEKKKGKRKQWTEDDDLLPSENSTEPPVHHILPPIANILPALRKHGDAILHSFIYPESRASFIQMLERVGVLSELSAELGSGLSSSEVEFWSYWNHVGDEGEKSMIPQKSTVKRV